MLTIHSRSPLSFSLAGPSVHGVEFGHLPDNITVLEGDSVILRCKIDEEVTHKAWLNRSNILFAGTDKWSLDKRVSLINSNSSDFSIQIDKVEVADEGLYTCSFQASNKPRIAHVFLIIQGESPRTRADWVEEVAWMFGKNPFYISYHLIV
ncbi:hypothetical protein DPEC_G00350930 [Dallia pectoralis]|uniref:Uncharacterized protein n=1 Tax=Dallia pectoralis TaxID=75939 RepID=A0ACC2F1N9_DALPE|nr:hypothetical protein DPEC_G00350930 [Dallia pectoralis]